MNDLQRSGTAGLAKYAVFGAIWPGVFLAVSHFQLLHFLLLVLIGEALPLLIIEILFEAGRLTAFPKFQGEKDPSTFTDYDKLQLGVGCAASFVVAVLWVAATNSS